MVDTAPMTADLDVDAVAQDFLRSPYSGPRYVHWSLDRRVDAFLRRRGFSGITNSGDVSSTILHRVMTVGGRPTTAAAAAP